MTTRLLMCAPTEFDVRYVINPWMQGHLHSSERDTALAQWAGLYLELAADAQIALVEPDPDCPDMVFTANAGFVLGERVAISRFRHAERSGEERHFKEWFERNGFEVMSLPGALAFEGAGDALLDRRLPLVWMGHGHRSDLRAALALERLFDVEVVPLLLGDPRFYHLDTCLCALPGGELMYFPAAFDDASLRQIEARVPESLRIVVDEDDACDFACNAVALNSRIVLNRASESLVGRLEARGYRVVQTPLGEFMKAGGAAKCLTLRLDEVAGPADRGKVRSERALAAAA